MTGNKYENVLVRMGAIVSNGILNAAGRNCSISLTTQDGNLRQNAIVGLVLFTQYWYWYPMMNFLPLALTPTILIGVNHQLKVPKSFNFTVHATPSTFKYPEMTKKKEKEEKGKVETAVLSTTAKVKARIDRKHRADGGDVEMSVAGDQPENQTKTKEEIKEPEQVAQPEPQDYVVYNPARVLRAQEQKI
jgi:26S proteasome regulatory subunit N2